MANEKSLSQKRSEHNDYERARSRLKRGGRTDSIAAAIRNQTVPEPAGVEKRMLARIVKDSQLDLNLVDTSNFEAMNQRQMAIGQALQKIAAALIMDEDWKQIWLEKMGPAEVIKMLDCGIKIERQAMMSVVQLDRGKDRTEESVGMLNLAGRLLDRPDLVDSVHDLIQDDGEE